MKTEYLNDVYRSKDDWIELWNQFKSGDAHSFEIIYSEFIDQLFAYGLKMTEDREIIKDCIQEIFIRLYNYNIDLKNVNSLEYYLIKSLKRQIIDRLSKNSRFGSLSELSNYSFKITFDFEEEYIQNEADAYKIEQLKKLLASLSNEKRELIYLRFHTGLSYHEIGDFLGIKPDTAKKQIYRLLDQIKVEYGAKILEMLMVFLK